MRVRNWRMIISPVHCQGQLAWRATHAHTHFEASAANRDTTARARPRDMSRATVAIVDRCRPAPTSHARQLSTRGPQSPMYGFSGDCYDLATMQLSPIAVAD